MSEPILTVANMNKKFGSTVALNDVSLTVYPGEIRGLIGENGSGKSTVTSIVAGMQECDIIDTDIFHHPGRIRIHFLTINQAELILILFRLRKENILSYRNPRYCSALLNNHSNSLVKCIDHAKRLPSLSLKNIGVNDVTGEMLMQKLDFQTRKLVEIAKVVMKEPQILVIDETSTALSHDGREILYDIMNRFRKENKSVIFISHDLDEIMEVCDTLTVLRDGKIIRTFEKAEFEAGAIRASMIGRELQGDYYRSDFQASSQPEVALDVRNLVYEDRLKGISFQVHKGEIVGIGGLAHCGMHSLGKVCFGALKPEEGSVTVEDGTIIDSPAIAMKKRVGYVSKDRDVESLCLNASIEDNISIAGMSEFAINNFLILKNREKKYVNHQIEELSIKCAGRDQSVSQLSGGNKQKVVFGKWIGCGSEILILDCPTRGVDIGVKQAMYQLMVRLKNKGKSILMISEELPELIGMSDRILIMKNGEVSAEFERSETLSDAQIIEYMI